MSSLSAAGPPGRRRPTISRAAAARSRFSTGRTHQALRRRHPAAADPRFRHSGASADGARAVARDGLAQGRSVDMPIEGGFVGMVDRDEFDEWLRERAAQSGATRRAGRFERITRDATARPSSIIRPKAASAGSNAARAARHRRRRRDLGGRRGRKCRAPTEADFVFAYHEIVETPPRGRRRDPTRAARSTTDGALSPDFYGWIFPHGDTMSVGTGSAQQGLLAARRRSATLRGLQGSTRPRRSAARARRSR